MNHPCEVQALGRTVGQRMRDRLVCGHARHVCKRERPAFREHEGDHECGCGQTFAKLATDDGPAPRVGLFRTITGD